MKTTSAAESRFIERLGLTLGSEGYSRVAGRIFALLLVTEPPLSLDDIADRLEVSKASVSTNARLLELRGVALRVSLPGDRRDHYAVSADMPARTMQQRLARLRRFCDVIEEGRTSLDFRTKQVRDRFEDLAGAYAFILEATAHALAELPRIREQATRRTARPR